MGQSGITAVNDERSMANLVWTAPNAEDVTVYVSPSGVDTDGVKYLNKQSDGSGFSIVADQDVEIFSIQHGGTEKLIGDPIQVAINTRFTRAVKFPSVSVIGIRILTANTTVQLLVF